jgi:uncharacterized protein YjcR
MEHAEIAEELGYKPQTIRKWFSEGKIEQVKRKFSDREKYLLERALEQDIWDAEQNAKDLLADAQRLAEESKDFRQIAESQVKIREKKIKLLQELGVVKKPKERKEVEEKSEGPTEINIQHELVEDEEELNEQSRD